MLTAGSGHSTAPTVVVEAPPKPLGVKLEMVPKLTVEGPAGSNARVESAASLSGPWTMWTNVTVGAEGAVLVDLSPGAVTRLHRGLLKSRLAPPTMFRSCPGPSRWGACRTRRDAILVRSNIL